MAKKRTSRVSVDDFNQLLPDVSCEVDDPALEPIALLPFDAFQVTWDAQIKRLSRAKRADSYKVFRAKKANTVRNWFKNTARNLNPDAHSAIAVEFVKDGGEWIESVLKWVQHGLFRPPNVDKLQSIVERRDSLMHRYSVLLEIDAKKATGSRSVQRPGSGKEKRRKGRKRPPRDVPTPKEWEAYTLRLHGHTYRDIGESLGISDTAAHKRVRRAERVLNTKCRSIRTQALPHDRRGQVTTTSRKGKRVKKPIDDD